jgi:DNA polymerase III epsilon subunit family exonuclease
VVEGGAVEERSAGPSGYAVVDTETTGFGAHDRVIEVGVVLLDEELGRTGQWDTLINPNCDLGPTSIHHIHQGDLIGAPDFGAIAGELVEQLRGRVIVGHNVGFDARMLNQEFDRLGAGRPIHREFCLDTVRLSRTARLSDTNCYTLDHLCATLAIERTIAHAALADAEATAELLVRATTARLGRMDGDEQGPDVLWAGHHQAARRADWPAWPVTGTPRQSRFVADSPPRTATGIITGSRRTPA